MIWIIAFVNTLQSNTIGGTATNPMSVNQVVNGSNQFTLNGYSYDAAGNVLADGSGSTACAGNAYAWNAEEEMTCALGASYTYDGDGIRVKKTGGSSTPTLYWGSGTLAESDASGNLTSEYIFLNGRRIARRDIATGSVYYYFADTLGSSNVVATSAGALENESDFYPFGGESVVTQNLTNQKYKFEGKERDPESASLAEPQGLDYFTARYYGSSMGRFMSPDPLGWLDWQHGNEEDQKKFEGFISDPQHFNQYAYVLNNPLKFTDPDGLLEYIAKLLGKDIKVHIDDNLTDKQQNSLKGRLDAAIKNVNDHAGSLTGDQKSVLGNIKCIDVDGSLKRSFVNESGGDLHLTTDYVKQGSTAWLGSAIGHDGFHVQEFKMGGIGASRGTDAEKGAFQFQLGLGQKIGFNSTETNYLKNLIAHPESLSGYYNSPVK